MKILIVAALAALMSSATIQPGPPTPAQFATARRLLDERLLDYPAARFRDVHGNAGSLCGFVNAKNRMGAYTGWKRFAVIFFGDAPSVYSDDDEKDDVMLDAFCGDDGRLLSGPDLSERVSHR